MAFLYEVLHIIKSVNIEVFDNLCTIAKYQADN